MLKNIIHKVNTEVVLSYFLGFIVLYIGAQEVLSPAKWTIFVPEFLGNGPTIVYLVILHGLLLLAVGFAFIFNFHRRIAAFVLSLMLFEIIINLLVVEGLSEIALRDIGLLGMAIALALKN